MSTYAAIDLAGLAAPIVIETLDPETILAEIKADVIERAPELEAVLELESEPAVKILEAAAFREYLVRARINDAARSVMLAFAVGSDLDHLSALLGVERLDGETDDEFRDRTQLSLEGFTTAGPVGAYEYHAKSAHSDVKDVYVSSPTPGTVSIAVLSDIGDGTPETEVLDAVEAAVNADDVRPLTDFVVVSAATISSFSVVAEITFADGESVPTRLAEIEAAVQAYVDAKHVLGGVVSVSGLYAALHQSGVVSATMTAPTADIEALAGVAPYCSAITISEAAA